MAAKPYTVAGRHFPRQGDLDAAIKAALNQHPRNVEFTDEFLAAVINELHPDVLAAGQKVERFQYLTWDEQLRRNMPTAGGYRGGGIVLGWFEPLGRWEDVTVYPHRQASRDSDLRQALRIKINPYLPRPTLRDHCDIPTCPVTGYGLEYEHANPTFKQIVDACLALMTEEERATRFGYNKFDPARRTIEDCIPDTHPAVRLLFEGHTNNQWMWLCKFHHRNVQPSKEVRWRVSGP
jgi:hypothetical protein